MKALVWILTSGLALAAAEPPMPSWSAEDRKALAKGELIPGQVLLDGDAAEALPVSPEVPGPTDEEIAEAEQSSPRVAEKFLEAYFGERPAAFLVDPQQLLGTKETREREEFLKYHSGDSEIDLYVYLFDGHQEIPSEVREEEVVERFFSSGKPAVVAYYYLGAPQKTEIQVSPGLGGMVSAAEQRRALSSSVEEALEKPDAYAQLEAFCVQLSIRIYWMERAAGLVGEAPVVPVAVRAKSSPAPKEVSPVVAQAKEWALRYGPPAGIMAGAILIVVAGVVIARRRMRYEFPVFEVSPRLGGSHAAGIGAVISFGSTTQSPSSQRNEVPDYLGL
ncbi:hypothetical protein [Luteolibacter marinus]|uniref:hypothetical protein n=1 Tax=Luteolibacter marinus TaxID=2776705 RepID=UPI0018662A1B|nr:hypothetical protein [Luteolibacter marinus]